MFYLISFIQQGAADDMYNNYMESKHESSSALEILGIIAVVFFIIFLTVKFSDDK